MIEEEINWPWYDPEDKTLLKPHHFQQEPKPIIDDYVKGLIKGTRQYNFDEDSLEKAVQFWEKKYIKPQPEWIEFESVNSPNDPKEDQSILVCKNPKKTVYVVRYTGERFQLPHSETQYKINKSKFWADKETYDKRLAYWRDHQVKFDGFDKSDYEIENFSNGEFEIIWEENGVRITSNAISCWNQGGWTVSQFEAITGLKAKANA